MKNSIIALLIVFTSMTALGQTKPPNIVMIVIDDLNDWVEGFDGHPLVKTPNIDRFAKTGLTMYKAYAPSTVCCPSRTAILTGKHATNTGVYGNSQNIYEAPKAMNVETLPEYFGNRGYHTLSTGKIFHLNGGDYSKYFKERVETGGKGGVLWSEKPTVEGVKSGGTDFTWGATTAKAEEMKDFLATKWATEQLNRDFGGKPFFLSLGISKPHLPWFVPQRFYDMYPLDKIVPVEIFENDLDDIKDGKGKQLFQADNRFLLADKTGKHKQAQQAYLACISYVDYCLGQLFDALEKSKYADNTIVMLWGDHGWHLSEKLKYGKTDLWEESCRVPFIVKVPGLTPKGVKSNGVVNLIDIYPTLLDLCGLPANKENDGRSFAKLLANPTQKWNVPTLTTYQYKNHSLTDGRYRYTWYGGKGDGGGEELYDHAVDPLEHTNLASNAKYKSVIQGLKKYLPTHHEPNSPFAKKDEEGDAEEKIERQNKRKEERAKKAKSEN